MKTKIILLLTLLLAMTQGVMAWEGSGTETDPYLISSTQDLTYLAIEDVQQGTYFSLTADIDLGGGNNDGESNFTPIGTTTVSFNGVFLGNNHTISGVRIKRDVNGSMNVGLFGEVGMYATVKDLTLANSFIEGGGKVGGIVGCSTWSGNEPDEVCTIENCRVVNTTVRGSYSVGAIIGEAYATVTNCHVATDVTVRGISTNNSYIGGVAGDMNRGTIAGCASAAAVSAEAVTPLPSFFGGIVGAAKNDDSVTILDNLFLGSIAAGNIVSRGSIVGAFYSGTKNMVDNSSIPAGALSRNFYIDKDQTAYASKGVRNSDVTTDNGAVQATASVLNDIFVYEGTVTNYQHDAELGTVTDLTASDNGIDYDGTFYYVGSNSIIHFAAGSGSAENPFLISNTAEWNKLALATNSNSSFNSSPRYLKQTGDVSVTIAHMVGTAYPTTRPFTGYYDGNGQTLTVDLQDDDMTIIAPFRYISGATIENLYVTGTVYGSNYTAGLVGQTVGSESVNTVANCRVSADVWTYNKNPTSTVSGGIVYNSMDGTLHITGCLFEGKLASDRPNEIMAGTIVGVCSADDVVKHCLDNRTDAGDNNYVTYAIARQVLNMGNQFTEGDPIDHSYSTHSSASIECCTFNVGMELGGDVVTYSVSGITGGAPGVQHTDFSKIVFVEKDEVVRMKLTPPHGYAITKATMKWNNYESQAILAKDDNDCYTFTVPTAAIEYYLYPESDYTTEFEGTGTEEDPYLIYNTTQLNSMSSKINSGEGEYYKAHYKLMDDIGCWDDFVPIGKPNSGGHNLTFWGTFDGNGHTVFNIRLTRTGTDETSSRLGLFGYATNGAVIKNVIISNSTFQGYQYVGAILGYGSGVTIENCHVKNNVSITTYDYPTAPAGNISDHGGIAGYVSTGTIKGCTSAAQFSTLPNVDFNYTNWGGIVGYAGTTTIQDCVYTGNGSSNTSNRLTAICGGYSSGCTLSNNLFTNTTLKGVSTGNVEEGMNIDEKAQPGYRRGKKPAYIGDVVTTYKFADNKPGTVAYTEGVSYDGSYYVRSLVTKNVAYIDADGNEQHVDAYVLDGTEDRFDSEWFVAEGEVNYDSPVMVTTHAKLILADGSRLTFATPDKTAIESEQETSSHTPLYDLAIFGQSEQTGQLTVTMSDGWDLGIQVKDYFQYGGDVTITAPTEGYGNGIMAGRYSTYTYAGPTGNVLMKRGKLTSNQTICANGKIDVLGGQTDVYSLYAALAHNKTGDEYVDQFRITLSWASPYDKITVKNYKVVYAYKGVLTNKTENGRIWLHDDFVDSQWNIEKQYIHNDNVVESGTVIIDGRTLQPGRLTLSNDAENATLLPLYHGLKMVQVTLKGRNLYKDKNWNTLCLPFSLTEAELSAHGVLRDYDIRALNSSSFANGTLTLNFSNSSETAITAGEPYLVQWTGDYSPAPFEDLTFNDVTISKDAGTRETAKANLVATFEPVTLEANDKSVLFLGSGNTLYWPTADVKVGAFRAYFELNGITAGDLNANPARAFVLNFGNETTGIVSAEANSSLFTLHSSLSEWYTLDGRQIDGKPTQKGLYINKGKKVIIK